MAVHEQDNLAPGLLIAMPQLRDPNFHRMVVLMLEHNEEGSFGVVVNNPCSASVTIQSNEGDSLSVGRNVFIGGPVSPHVCMVVHGSGWRCERTKEVVEGLCISEPSASMPHLLEQTEVPYRFIMGYAGWGPGQLSSEMTKGAWLTSPVRANLVIDEEPEKQWEAVISNLGIDPMMLIPATTLQ